MVCLAARIKKELSLSFNFQLYFCDDLNPGIVYHLQMLHRTAFCCTIYRSLEFCAVTLCSFLYLMMLMMMM